VSDGSRLVRCSAWALSLSLVALWTVGDINFAGAQISFEKEPINYYSAPVDHPVARLQERLAEGGATLEFHPKRGYLDAVLEHLGVSASSQMLVFSKTSFQASRISPRNPRAIYFDDDVYVGWVRGGDVVEVSAVDPQLGAVFYTLKQTESPRPKFVRDRGNCMSCHASSHTRGVPGHTVRSVYAAPGGMPHYGAGTFRTNHESPFEQRWGGWYVTGTHGRQRHMGNVVVPDPDSAADLDLEPGANVTDLAGRFSLAGYLSPHSDLVALMVLEHQTEMHNLITSANYAAQMALRDAAIMDEALGRQTDPLSESTRRRIASAGDRLLRYMLFVDEAPLVDPIRGTSTFAEEFAARGPSTSDGRSLRELDLDRRLFKYPCSYLIYSEAFEALPEPMLAHVYRQLWEVLAGRDNRPEFDHLSRDQRQAILEILRETKADLPSYWRRGA